MRFVRRIVGPVNEMGVEVKEQPGSRKRAKGRGYN